MCRLSAPRCRQITTPVPHCSVFLDAFPAAQSVKELRAITATITITTTTTTIVLRPFVWYYPGELVPEETFTHAYPSHQSSVICFLHLQSTASFLFNLQLLQLTNSHFKQNQRLFRRYCVELEYLRPKRPLASRFVKRPTVKSEGGRFLDSIT